MGIKIGTRPVIRRYVGSREVTSVFLGTRNLYRSGLGYLFGSGENGAWYDPSDWTTLFQDAAGTTPVTAMGQPVGLMLDKRLGLVRGPELCTDPTLSTPALWQFTGTAPLWSVSGGKAEITATSAGNRWLKNGIPLTIGKTYEVTADVVVSAGSVAPDIGVSGVDATTSGSKRWIITATTATLQFVGRSAFIGSIDNISVREIPGNHATQPTAINRPVLQIDGSGKYYLAFNGTNSWMSTPAINFTATDKMTVVAGVRKLSDAAAGCVAELSVDSTANNGSWALKAPFNSAVANVGASSKGSLAVTHFVGSPYTAPHTAILSAVSGISTDTAILRVNATQAATSSADQGVGNFGNYPIYLGARAGTSQFFNGNLYGLVIRGALSTAPQITDAENFMNIKTGAY